MIAGPGFVAAFLAEGGTRGDGYRPLRHPVSSLALGPRGWVQNTNFVVTGSLFLAAAVGLARAGDPAAGRQSLPALVGAAGAGLIGAAFFPTDPVSGYPAGTPGAPEKPTRTGGIHNLMAVPVFVGLPIAALVCGWRDWRAGRRSLALCSAGSAVTTLAGTTLASAGFGQSPRFVGLGGLFQRVSIIACFGWLAAVSARGLRAVARRA